MNETSEGLPLAVAKNQTERLIQDTIRNVDPVTGLPYQTPETRGELARFIEEARSNGKPVLFVDIDLNNLKGLNDRHGHDGANVALKLFGEQLGRRLEEKDDIEMFCLYRPQAGGDEYRAVTVMKGETTRNELAKTLEEGVKWGEEELTGAVGVSEIGIDGTTLEELQKAENEAEKKLAEQKLQYIEKLAKNTVEVGRRLSSEDYIAFLEENWGTMRIRSDVLRMILMHVRAKTIKEMTQHEGNR